MKSFEICPGFKCPYGLQKESQLTGATQTILAHIVSNNPRKLFGEAPSEETNDDTVKNKTLAIVAIGRDRTLLVTDRLFVYDDLFESIDKSTISLDGCDCCPLATRGISIPGSCKGSRLFGCMLMLENRLNQQLSQTRPFYFAGAILSGDPYEDPSSQCIIQASHAIRAAWERAREEFPPNGPKHAVIALPLPSAWKTTLSPHVGHMLGLMIEINCLEKTIHLGIVDTLEYARKTPHQKNVYKTEVHKKY